MLIKRKKVTWDFIFEYNDYIQNIYDKTNINDIYIFNGIKNYIIVEGLIKTQPSDTSINIISKRFTELTCNIEPDGEIYIEGDFNQLKNYLPIFTNLGYFISKLTLNGNDWINDFNEQTTPLALFLEPKYDVLISKLPNILYHVSPSKYDSKIHKIGVIPKTKNKLSNHPDRIYLTDDIKYAEYFKAYLEEYLKNNSNKNLNINASIYEINTKNINIRIYQDVNLKGKGYYTLDNIPPGHFKKIIK